MGKVMSTMSPESKMEKSTIPRQRFAKTDMRYWQDSLFHPTFTRAGAHFGARHWAVKIQYLGQRKTFSLGTPNKAAAAGKAKDIYLSLKANGWIKTLAIYKPKAEANTVAIATVGDLIAEVKAKLGRKPKTIESYCRALRTIVADSFGIDGGKSKFDAHNGGRAAWLAKIHAVKLADITPARVQEWKVRFLRRAGDDPVKQRRAKISVNSLMRQAKSLFAPAVRKFITLDLPVTLPFVGVDFESRPSMRYRSDFDIAKVVTSAQSDLPIEQLKIFLLGAIAGLRRNEIDKLPWSAFRWQENVIRIDTTCYFEAKRDSVGDIEVDPELMIVFRGFHAKAKSPFVIESKVMPRPGATYSHYRCQRHFVALTKWLRAQGVHGLFPLHKLRKEFGSQVCAKHGIYAASYALRHADIAITSQHYLDKKRSATAGLGHLLQLGGDTTRFPVLENLATAPKIVALKQ